MTSKQRFKDDFLSSFKRLGGSERYITAWDFQKEYGIEPQHVKELLLKWASEESLISLEAYDGAGFRPWQQWKPPEAVFASSAASNRVRVKLLDAGAEYAELISRRPDYRQVISEVPGEMFFPEAELERESGGLETETGDFHELDRSKPLVLLLGNVDHEGVVSPLKAAGRQYKKKLLDSKPENWRAILDLFSGFRICAVVIKLTSQTYELLADGRYHELGAELLRQIASVPHVAFAYESLISGREVTGHPYFSQPSTRILASVNGLLRDSKLNVIPYRRNAELTVLAGEFISDTEQGLLFRVYVPAARLWANEVDRLLQLFRDYLAKTGRTGVRLDQFRTEHGTAYEFHGVPSPGEAPLSKQFQEFSHLLDLCISSPADAESLLREKDVGQRDIVEILTRYSKEARRLQVDLKQDRERKLLSIRHRLESELTDASPATIDLGVVAALVDRIVPYHSEIGSAYLIDQRALRLPAAEAKSLTININSHVIEKLDGILMAEVRGNVNLTQHDRDLLELIQKYGQSKAAELASAVHELSDEEIPKVKRLGAKQKLKAFLYELPSRAGDIVVRVLETYVEKKLGL
ncbi:MAG: hypothetical protein ABSH52_35165 [Terriglobia bacterium]